MFVFIRNENLKFIHSIYGGTVLYLVENYSKAAFTTDANPFYF